MDLLFFRRLCMEDNYKVRNLALLWVSLDVTNSYLEPWKIQDEHVGSSSLLGMKRVAVWMYVEDGWDA